MPTPSRADRLLAAHVEFVLAELDDGRLLDTLTGVVDDVLAVAASITLAEVAGVDTLQGIARRVVSAVGASPGIEQLVGAVADAVYANEGEYLLGQTVDREPVERLVAHLLGMRTLQDRVQERFTESPLVGVVASKFLATIVNDFVQQNRQRAEKVPGMGSLLSLGQSAASRIPGKGVLSDAAGKGAQFAIKRTNGAMREMMRDAPLQGAAMELWDLHADEPVGDLRAYLSAQELRELVLIVHDLLSSARDSQLAGDLVDLAVAVFVEQFGDLDLATLLAGLGFTRDDLVADVTAFAPSLIAAARTNATLADAVRHRLEPFYRSAEARAILGPTPRTAS